MDPLCIYVSPLCGGMGLLFGRVGLVISFMGSRQTLQDSVSANVVYVRCAEAVHSINAYHPLESAQGTVYSINDTVESLRFFLQQDDS